VMMKSVKLLILAVTSTFLFKASAQEPANGKDNYIHAVRTESTNFIYCFGYSNSTDFSNLQNIDYFILERYELKENDSIKQNTATRIIVKAAQTEEELTKALSSQEITQFLAQIKGESIQDLLRFIQDKKNPKDIGPAYISPKVKMAVGHLYEDKDIDKTKSYLYKVKARTLNGKELNWGYSVLTPTYTNHTLDFLKPKLSKSQLFDSVVVFTWYLDVSQKAKEQIISPTASNKYQEQQIAFFEDGISNTLVQVNYLDSKGRVSKEMLVANLSLNGDSLIYSSIKNVSPGEFISSYVRVADEVGNLGLASDTSAIYAVTKDNMPILSTLYTDEIEDGIVISWNQVPYLPYIAGIEVIRINSDNAIDTIGIFPKTETSFIDYAIEVGQTYTYLARLVFSQGVDLEQTIPAITTGQQSMFSKPNIPQELKATEIANNITLDWKRDKNPNVFGYFIYRGTNYFERQLIAGPITDTSYIDTADGLSGGNTYYYSVITQNLMQDTSMHSNVVEITPNRKSDIQPPLTADFYLSTEGLIISWQDVSELDNLVGGYVLYKKANQDSEMTKIVELIKGTTYTDTEVNMGDKVEYAISSVSYRGDEGQRSQPFYYDSKITHLAKMNTFSAKNIDEGILIGIPTVIIQDRAKYKIYRQDDDGATKLIGEIKSGDFEFIDKTVRENTNYFYGISIVFSDGQEGNVGMRKSIIRRR
jgi:hypothetical protein